LATIIFITEPVSHLPLSKNRLQILSLMKKLVLFTLAICIASASLFAQKAALPGMKYQAALRDAAGQVLANRDISLRIRLLAGDENGKEVYGEVHQATTTDLGLIALNIGEGTVLSGNFAKVPWSQYNIWMEIALDEEGGEDFVVLSASRLLAVPYAFHAGTADAVAGSSSTDDEKAAAYWKTNGNSGNLPQFHFLGTIDNLDLIFKTNNYERMRIYATGNVGINQTLNIGDDLYVADDATIGGDLLVNGDLTVFNLTVLNDLAVGNDAAITNDLSVGGDADVTGGATVGTNLMVGQDATVVNDLNIGGDADVTGGATVGTNLMVGQDATVVNDLNIGGDADVTGGATVGTDLMVGQDATVVNDLNVGGDADVTGGATVGTNLMVGQDATVVNDLNIGGDADVTGGATVGTNLMVGQDATVVNDLNVGGDADVTGGATVGTNLMVGQDVTVVNDLNVGGDAAVTGGATVGTNLMVGQDATVVNDLNVGGDADVTGGATVGASLMVGQDATVVNDLNVGGDADVTGGATVGTNLMVGQDATVVNDLNVGGDANVTGSLDVNNGATISGNANISSNLTVTNNITTTNGDITVGDDLTVSDDLRVNGSSSLNGVAYVGAGIAPYANVGLTIRSDFTYNFRSELANGNFLFYVRNDGQGFFSHQNGGLQSSTGSYSLLLENPDQGMFIRINKMDPTAANNFIIFTQLDSNNGTVVAGRVESNGSGGVTYGSGGADYAEYLMRKSTETPMSYGDIVGVANDGTVSRQTEGANRMMVVTNRPVVLGNMPDDGDEQKYEKVGFMGQLPVKVWGSVEAGDYVLPSGHEDGTGIARSPEEMEIEDYNHIVGVAWEGSDEANVKYIHTAIGLNQNDLVGVAARQEKEIEQLKADQENLKNQYETLLEKVNQLLEMQPDR